MGARVLKIDTTGFTDKASKSPEELALYKKADNYIEAYSAHTDLRVRRDGHAQAIGGDWESHGPLQLKFLRNHGLTPESWLLDFGCGTGRLSRHAVPFLEPGHYIGMDISRGALDYAEKLSVTEGWAEKDPLFILGDGRMTKVLEIRPDIIWAHSIFTHLPPELIREVLDDVSSMEFGVFLYTYKERKEPMRSGLKQFGYPPQWFVEEAAQRGLQAEKLGECWPQGQNCMRIVRV